MKPPHRSSCKCPLRFRFRSKFSLALTLALVLVLLGLISLAVIYRNVAVRTVHQVTFNTLSLEKLHSLPQLQIGDIVLRQGVGADSMAIAAVSNSRYSHCGMIIATSPEVLIIHATTADDAGIVQFFQAQSLQAQSIQDLATQDHDSPTQLDSGLVIVMPLRFFVEQATDLAVLRYPSLTAQDIPQLQAALRAFEGQPFSLDDSNPDSIYCTTLLEKALLPLIPTDLKRQQVNAPLGLSSSSFLFPEAFLHDSNALVIYEYGTSEHRALENRTVVHPSSVQDYAK